MSTARDKGTRAETAVVRFLRDRLSPLLPAIAPGIDRHPLHGAADVGDIRGVPDTVIQVKNTKRIDLAGALDSARAQAANADAELYAAWIKRRGLSNPGEWSSSTAAPAAAPWPSPAPTRTCLSPIWSAVDRPGLRWFVHHPPL